MDLDPEKPKFNEEISYFEELDVLDAFISRVEGLKRKSLMEANKKEYVVFAKVLTKSEVWIQIQTLQSDWYCDSNKISGIRFYFPPPNVDRNPSKCLPIK